MYTSWDKLRELKINTLLQHGSIIGTHCHCKLQNISTLAL